MKEMGYEVITKTPKGSPRVHPIVRIVDGGKNFRLDKLGEYYELDSIKQRIQNNYRRKTPFPEVAEDTKAPYYQYKEKAKKATGLYALYLYYCYELHIIVHQPASVKKVSAFLREDVTKLDRYIAQADFLAKTGIETVGALDGYKAEKDKTADEMAAQYGFNEDQKQQLAELLAQDSSMWAAVLYGIYGVDDQIVAVALSQVGNVGGEPYWSWYGFGSRVEWCACFVSWCANECGYIDTGVIPKFAGCVNGVQWFRERGQWADNSMEPSPGMIIFFDWDNKGSSGPQDGQSDHVGIVQKVENGVVYTIEGNSGDSCRVNQYPVGYYEILGYGVVAY